jgi:hypothetical protein
LAPKEADRGYKGGYKMWRIDGRFRYRVNDKNVIFEKIYSLGGVEARGGWRPKLFHFVEGRCGGLAPALARR